MTDPWAGINRADEQDALDSITHMLVGTKMLQNEPGVVYSLAAMKARPQDAQAIDQFMQSLEAEKRVQIARASGEHIMLSPTQTSMLQQNGVQYQDVQYGHQDPAANAPDSEAAKQALLKKLLTPSDGGGGLGGFFDAIGSPFKAAAGGVFHGLMKGYNFAQAAITGQMADKLPGHQVMDVQDNVLHNDATRAEDMRAAGYDPGSTWSALAFASSGKGHTDLSGLIDQYGQDKVDETLRYLNDPKKYRESIEQDPNNYIQTADGQTVLTQDAASKLQYLASKDFETLARQVNAKQATVGNDLANAIGIDPVHHATAYGVVSATANLAASFVIDPSLIALQGVKVAKLASVGIDTLGDSEKAASLLLRETHNPYILNVQRGWQKAIDYGQQMREAHAAGDMKTVTSLTAKFNAELPALSPLMGEFVGEHALLPMSEWSEGVVAGKKTLVPAFGKTDGIRSMEDAADWIRSKQGLNLLRNGRAAAQSGLMPGAVSAFGYRKLKGATSGWMTGRSYARADKAYTTVITRAEADPVLAEKLIDEGILMRMPAQADDAIVFHNGQVLAEAQPVSGLASANRTENGTVLALTAAGKGQIARNLRATGDALGELKFSGPAAWRLISSRFRLAAQRFTTLLPRNTVIKLDDPRAGDSIYKWGMTYLNRGDAQALRAAWNFGGYAERKRILDGIRDQVAHAAGLGKTQTGRNILDEMRVERQAYSAAGNEIEVDGQRMALTEGQTREQWTLPSFQLLQQGSAKFGLWESTFGRALTARQADALMSEWKMLMLGAPKTVTRNLIEGWARTGLEGKFGEALQARILATTRHGDLFKAGYGQADRELFIAQRGKIDGLKQMLKDGGLSKEQRANAQDQLREAQRLIDSVANRPAVLHQIASEAGDTARVKEIENGSLLAGQTLGRSATANRIANFGPIALAAKAYHALNLKYMDEARIDAMFNLGPGKLTEWADGYGKQVLESDLGFTNAARHSTDIAEAGLGPSKIRVAVHEARKTADGTEKTTDRVTWTHEALDGTVGVTRYANELARRVNAMPQTARAVLGHIQDPENVLLPDVVKALEAESKQTSFGHIFWDDPVGFPEKARTAVTDAEREAGKYEWANKLVHEYKYLLTSRNNEFQQEIADYITEHGVAPDGAWIADHINAENRPATALAPEVMAMPNGGLQSLPQALQDIQGAVYQWTVERMLQRTTSMPVFLANYAEARVGLNKNVEQLIEAGFSREAVNNFAEDLAGRNAWVKTEQLIDDPGQKAQFDVLARNMIPFARATQAMIRRWGTGLWQNPAAARKLMLSYEGAVHSGLVYTNVYGEPTFTYPGSGAMNMAMRAISELPGFDNVAAFPVSGDMTGGVLMAVPGADNPFRMGMGPMISIPFREVYKHLLPASWRGDMTALDDFINGPVGQGETFMQLVPSYVRRFYQAFEGQDRNAAVTSAMNGAFANLAAAGLVPTTEDANSPAVMQQFRNRLQDQVRSQLFLRAVFGLVAPAAPSLPTEGTSGSGADYAWSVEGLQQLSDEYKSILNEVGGDVGRANAVFTALHPDEVVYKTGKEETKLPASAYETAKSKSNAPGSYLPSTRGALAWLDTHSKFVSKYNSVAAYFLPEGSSNEPFSDAAYKAQIEFGLRLRKTPTEFMNDVYVKHAESVFYPVVQEWDRRINDAKASGNDALASQLTQQKSTWEDQFKALNPLLGKKMDSYGDARQTAQSQLSDIRLMIQHGEAPDGLGLKLKQLVKAYDNYVAFTNQYPGQTDVNSALRSGALDTFNRWAQQELTGTPLASLFNGVFRVLNTNFDRIDGGS